MQFLQKVASINQSMHFAEMDSIANLSAELKDAVQAMCTFVDRSGQANQGLLSAFTRQEETLRNVATKLAMLHQESTKITTSEKVLQTLVFKEIDNRAQQIHKEYPKTLSWLFDHNRTPLPRWMKTGHGVFWITGKAGSGKSTLMKFLAGHATTQKALSSWGATNNRQLATAAFYFWHSGTDMQTSQKGLLQSLLYQVFTQCPDMIKMTTPKGRWEDARSGGIRSWRPEELYETFENLVHHSGSLAKCFCFFIDGLDEYQDDFGGYGRLLDSLNNLARTPWIKLCVSSRPWNVFKSSLGKDDQRLLVVHDFTRPDMDIFIKGMLEEDARFGVVVKKDPRVWHLAVELRDRAEGVFLWVFLVVRRLLRLVGEMQHMEKDTTLDALQHALDELPSDLDDYFKHMVDTIDKAHRMHTAGTFRLAIHAAPLPLIAFWNLPIVMVRPESVLEAPICDVDDDENDDNALVRRTTDTINTWCKDLLEVCKLKETGEDVVSETNYQINFLHRTVRDFLVDNREVQAMFSTHLSPDFDPALTLLRLQIAQVKILKMDPESKQGSVSFLEQAQRCFSLAKSYERERKIIDPALLAELDRVGTYYSALWQTPDGQKLTDTTDRSHWSNALLCSSDIFYHSPTVFGQSTFLALTVAYDLVTYVKQIVVSNSDDLEGGKGARLLNYALHDLVPANRHTPSYDMVLLLLQGGANPNCDAKGTHDSDSTAWKLFLRRCYREGGCDLWPIAKLLLEFGADANVEFERRGQTIERLHAAKSFRPRIRNIQVPEVLSVRQCVTRCCSDPAELEKALKKAQISQKIIPQKEVAKVKRREESSFLQKIGLAIIQNLVTKQRRY